MISVFYNKKMNYNEERQYNMSKVQFGECADGGYAASMLGLWL